MDGAAQAQSNAPALTRRVITLLVALLASHALLGWALRGRGIFTFGDDAAYLLLGRSLRAISYREVQFIGEPVAARFPPGYPALLAIVGAFGERLSLIAAAGIALSVSGLFAVFDVIRRRWSIELALLVTAAIAVNPTLATDAGAIASEAMFTALVLWSLWAADRYATRHQPGVLAGAMSIAAAMTRSAGVTAPLALGLHWLLRRRVRAVVMLALAAALTVGSWLAWTTFAPRREVRRSYIDDAVDVRAGDGSVVSTLAHRLQSNISVYAGQTAPDQLGFPFLKGTQIDNVAWVLVIGVLGLAGAVSAWRRWNAAVVWVATYAALLAVWTFTIDRFLHPLLPMLIALMVIGAWELGVWLGRSRSPGLIAPTLASAALCGLALRVDVRLAAKSADCDRARVDCAPAISLDYVDAAIYANTHSPPSARFIAPKNATLYYYAPRKSVFWDEVITQDSASFLPYLDRTGVRYVILTPVYSDQLTLLHLTGIHCREFDLVRAFAPETFILERRDAPGAADSPACHAIARATARVTASRATGETSSAVNRGDAP